MFVGLGFLGLLVPAMIGGEEPAAHMIHFDQLAYCSSFSLTPCLGLSDAGYRRRKNSFSSPPSGAGKSTLLRCLNGLVPHFTGGSLSGSITVAEHDPVAEGLKRSARLSALSFRTPPPNSSWIGWKTRSLLRSKTRRFLLAEMRLRVEEALHI